MTIRVHTLAIQRMAIGVSPLRQGAPCMEIPTRTTTTAQLPPTAALQALANARRRITVTYLAEITDNEAPVDIIATHVAARKHDSTPDSFTDKDREQVYTALSHTHLPKLDDQSIVNYDYNRLIVHPSPRCQQLIEAYNAFETALRRTLNKRAIPVTSQ